jgi:hypothetical protein
MNRQFRLLAICLAAIMSSTLRVFGAVSAEERQKAFAWFDTLGYPPIANYPLAKVYDGEWSEQADGKRKPSYEYGFIVESDKAHFAVIQFTLWTERFIVRPATAQKERVYFEPVELQSYARDQIKIRTDTNVHSYPTDLKWPVEFFLLARACEARGQSDLAAKLCDLADKEMGRPESDTPAPPFLDRIADEIARYEIWRLVLDFEDMKIARETLLHRFETFLRNFPKGKSFTLAASMTRELKRMVREDQEHNALPPPQVGKVTQEGRIADLIFALRDQNGRQWGQPGSCDVFADPRGENSPASQLVKIGLPAVPALLDALTDSRLTRSVGFWRDYVFSHHVLPVGDVALAVLEEIARRRFESNLDWKSHPLWSEQAAAVQITARKWWLQVQLKGEAVVLAEAVQRGDDTSVRAAQRLVALYPDAALPALAKGIDQASTDENRQGLVQAAGNLQRPAVLPLLEKQMREGRDLGTRVQAALAVNKRGDTAAITCMENEWKRLKVENSSQEDLCRFLIECGSPEAIRLLGDGPLARKAETRFAVIRALDDKEAGAFAGQPTNRSARQAGSSHLSARAAAMQRVLVDLLQDKNACVGSYFGFGETRLSGPRICDAANFALAHFWPDRYSFHQSSSLFDRNRECLLMLNRWRTANGLRSLLLPTRPAIPGTSASTLRRLLVHWTHAAFPRQRIQLEAAIQQIGLAAIPAIRAAREQAGEASPIAQGLLPLEMGLSCIIREVRIASRGFVIGTEGIRHLTQLKGQPFTATACSDLIIYFMSRLPPHASGLRFYAYRDNDGSGFLIRVTFLRGAKKLSMRSFRQTDIVSAGSVSVLASGGSGYEIDGVKRFGMGEAEKAIQDALDSRPDTPVSVEIEREFVPNS